MSTPFQTIADVKRANKASGYHWFSEGALSFFDGRVESPLIGGRFFVSSERFWPSLGAPAPRLYTVREVNAEDGRVETFGEFQGYATKARAVEAAKGLVTA